MGLGYPKNVNTALHLEQLLIISKRKIKTWCNLYLRMAQTETIHNSFSYIDLSGSQIYVSITLCFRDIHYESVLKHFLAKSSEIKVRAKGEPS